MMCMRRPEESNTPYSLLSLLRWRRIHWPLELFKMTAPPSRTATPESLLVVVPPDRVNVSRYVASSFISSVTSLFNTVWSVRRRGASSVHGVMLLAISPPHKHIICSYIYYCILDIRLVNPTGVDRPRKRQEYPVQR
jgi:hypothetical protein